MLCSESLIQFVLNIRQNTEQFINKLEIVGHGRLPGKYEIIKRKSLPASYLGVSYLLVIKGGLQVSPFFLFCDEDKEDGIDRPAARMFKVIKNFLLSEICHEAN